MKCMQVDVLKNIARMVRELVTYKLTRLVDVAAVDEGEPVRQDKRLF